MGLLNTYFFGRAMPRPTGAHQTFISNLVFNLMTELRETRVPKNKYLVLPGEPITEDRNRLVPDVVVFEDGEELVIAVDIAMHHEVEPICDKYLELTERFPNAEFWIFDYEEEKLYLVDNKAKRIKAYSGERSYLFKQPFIKYFYDE